MLLAVVAVAAVALTAATAGPAEAPPTAVSALPGCVYDGDVVGQLSLRRVVVHRPSPTAVLGAKLEVKGACTVTCW